MVFRDGGSSQRVPQHDLAAEASLLGAMLLSSDAVGAAAERLTARDFYKPAFGHIFTAILALTGSGAPVDPVTVADELRRSGLLDTAGGPGALVEMMADTPSVSSAGRYAKIIEDHAVLRRLGAVGGELTEMSYTPTEDVDDAVDRAEALVFELGQRRVADTMVSGAEVADANLDALEALYMRGDAVTGTPTGFADLDRLTAGLQPGTLTVLGGRPSMGKSALALGLFHHCAIEQRRPALLFSLEMSQFELWCRLIANEARVDSARLRDGQLSESDWAGIARAVGRFEGAPFWIDDASAVTVMDIRTKARRLQSRVGQLGLVVVDYLQLMSGRGNAENRQVQVAEISRGLKILAGELRCPVVALSQLNRGLESRANKRPMMSDLKESGGLEQDADLVAFIYRDEVYNPESPDRGMAEVIVAKHRGGPTATVKLAWLPQYTKFASMARPGPPPPPRPRPEFKVVR